MLATSMLATMKLNKGYGLAAPQVGHSIQLLVFDCSEGTYNAYNQGFMINPKITHFGDENVCIEEGCLSFPGLFLNIWRPNSITVSYTDLSGNERVGVYNGLTARVIQHEYYHLNAVLLTDHKDNV